MSVGAIPGGQRAETKASKKLWWSKAGPEVRRLDGPFQLVDELDGLSPDVVRQPGIDHALDAGRLDVPSPPWS
jgi:hypothetical protein